MSYGEINLGRQVILWFSGCQPQVFEYEYLNDVLEKVCQIARVKVVKTVSYVFPLPGEEYDGLTIVKVLAESDLTAHTYPKAEEGRSVVISIYACGREADLEAPIDFLKKRLAPEETKIFWPIIEYNGRDPRWKKI